MKPAKRLVSCILFSALFLSASAQNDLDPFEQYRRSMESRFEQTRIHNEETFDKYRDRVNREFASYLEREWSRISLISGRPYPFRPEPEPIEDDTPAQESNPLPFEPIELIPEPETSPKPIEPIEGDPIVPEDILPGNDDVVIPDDNIVIRPDGSQKDVPYNPADNMYVPFTYLGNECRIRAPKVKNFSLTDCSNEQIANAWTALSIENFNDMLIDCLCIRESLGLCDWALYQMAGCFTKAYFGSETSPEAVITQVYIMTQLGYRMRLAKQDGRLYAFAAFGGTLFSVPYCELSDGTFYCFTDGYRDANFEFCDYRFPGEQDFSPRMKKLPKAAQEKTPSRTVVSKAFPSAAVTVCTNRFLMDFYDSYPACSWEIQAASSLSQMVKDQIYPSLKRAITGTSQAKAANILLNFVQTGFEYETDDEQFGREKSFFGDETFYYPYCDCEDRSILFSILVRDLLNLEVVLLDYPSHIATAVKFTEDVTGDYFDIDGQKYVICDPTYIGAPIGKSMPDMLCLKANILKVE